MDLSKLELLRYWRGVIRRARRADHGGAGVADSGLNLGEL